MRYSKIIALSLVALQVSGCANEATRTALGQAQTGCASGDQSQCMAAEQLQVQAHEEAQQNGETAAKIILLPFVVIGAVAVGMADAQQQQPETVYVCHGYNCP